MTGAGAYLTIGALVSACTVLVSERCAPIDTGEQALRLMHATTRRSDGIQLEMHAATQRQRQR